MRAFIPRRHRVWILAVALAGSAFAQDAPIGRTVDSLLEYARNSNPEYAAMRHEADAADECVALAGALGIGLGLAARPQLITDLAARTPMAPVAKPAAQPERQMDIVMAELPPAAPRARGPSQ